MMTKRPDSSNRVLSRCTPVRVFVFGSFKVSSSICQTIGSVGMKKLRVAAAR